MDFAEPCQQAGVGSGERCPAPIRRDSVGSRTRAENDRQRSYCSEVRCRFSGRRGGRSNPSASLESRIHATALGRQGEANRPTITEAEISSMLTTLKGRDAVLVALVAGTGLRIGEALAIRTDDFDPLCRLLQVRRSVWRRREQAPKTLNAIRPVDIPESLAQVLCRYIKGRKGHLFTTSGTSSGLAQCPGCVAASGETRRIPRVPPLSFCGTPQGGGAGGPHQTVAGPFTKLNRPLRGATAVRRDLSEGMVRESWFGI